MIREILCPIAIRAHTHGLNARIHWSARARRGKADARCVWGCLHAAGVPHSDAPLSVALSRVAPRRMDNDNAIACLKGVRDAVARYFGVNDADGDPITWRYEQAAGPRYAVAITIEWEVIS